MDTINLNGKDVKLYKHMKDIKEDTFNGRLFNRWYNKGQFLKYILGRFEENGAPDKYFDPRDGEFGTLSGSIIHTGRTDWYIQIYKLDDMSPEDLDDFIENKLDSHFIATGFIMESNDGTLYAVDTGED